MGAVYVSSGGLLDFQHLDDHSYPIEEIALALARTPRFGGHTRARGPDLLGYSVAQHSCMVAREALHDGYSNEVALAALLHDAHEAYTGDIPTPLKQYAPVLVDLGVQVQTRILRAHDVAPCWVIPQIKVWDQRRLRKEVRFNVLPPDDLVASVPNVSRPWSVADAADRFLLMYYELQWRAG